MRNWIWTDSDYDSMSWHDNYIHAISFDAEEDLFDLDIDYITEWVRLKKGDDYFSFSVAPATLEFHQCSRLGQSRTFACRNSRNILTTYSVSNQRQVGIIENLYACTDPISCWFGSKSVALIAFGKCIQTTYSARSSINGMQILNG